MKQKDNIRRRKRKLRVRKRFKGRLRLCVVKTNKHLHVQIIDDEEGKTLVSTSTFAKDDKKKTPKTKK